MQAYLVSNGKTWLAFDLSSIDLAKNMQAYLTSNGQNLIGFGLVFYAFCHEAGQVSFTDGFAAGQVAVAKHDVGQPLLHILYLRKEDHTCADWSVIKVV